MRKSFYLLFGTFAAVLATNTAMLAQKPVKKSTAATAAEKKPNVKSLLGKVSGNSTLDAVTAAQLLSLPLKVTDDKNLDYVISSYQFAYKRIGVTEDEETGKTSPQSDVTADRFTTTPLPPLWQKIINEGLQKGEELYFFDIIVFDKNGRRFFAPELKITIQ